MWPFLLLACNQETIKADSSLPYPDSNTGSDTSDSGTCVPQTCNGVLDPNYNGTDPQEICLAFAEVANSVGLSDASNNHSGFSLFDSNNNTHANDLYLFNYGSPNSLRQNLGGTFDSDSAIVSGLNVGGDSRSAVWADYDSDGDNDLLLSGISGTILHKNNSGIFTELIGNYGIHDSNSTQSAIWTDVGFLLATNNGTRYYTYLGGDSFDTNAKDNATTYGLDDPGSGSALAVADYDGDGFDDIYLANQTGYNRLFKNNGDGTYSSIETAAGVTEMGNDSSTDSGWIVWPGDTLPSLYVADENGDNHLYRNLADGTFADQAVGFGLQDPGDTMSATWGDITGEGFPSLFLGRWTTDATNPQNNLLYYPIVEDGTITNFTNLATALHMDDVGTTLKAEWFDYDNDGDQDLLVVMYDGGVKLYQNNTEQINVCPE